MRRPLRHQHAAYLRAAINTGLAGALVNAMAELKKALAALGIHIVGNGRAAGCDGFREHFHDSAVKRFLRLRSPAAKSSAPISRGSGPRRATRAGNRSEYSMQPNCRLSS